MSDDEYVESGPVNPRRKAERALEREISKAFMGQSTPGDSDVDPDDFA